MRKKFYEKSNNKYYLQVASYANNDRLYIGVCDQEDDLVEDITVNLPDIKIKSDNQIFLSENISDNVKHKLLDKGIISKIETTQKYNMGKYLVANVNLDLLKEYDSQGVEEFLNIHQKQNNNQFNQYNIEEIKKLLKDNTKLVYIDTGIDEFIIKYEDLPDAIVDINNKLGIVDLKVYDYQNSYFEPMLTTFGPFLNKCDPNVRDDIIDRLTNLQTEEETIKEYKIINEDMLEKVKNSIENEEMER